MRSSYSTGAFTDGTPVICGGYPETTHCNIVKGQAKKFLAELSQERTYAASGVMNDGALWITGGYPGPTDTSELVMPGKNQSSMHSILREIKMFKKSKEKVICNFKNILAKHT